MLPIESADTLGALRRHPSGLPQAVSLVAIVVIALSPESIAGPVGAVVAVILAAAFAWKGTAWLLSLSILLSAGGGEYSAFAGAALVLIFVTGIINSLRLIAIRKLVFPVGIVTTLLVIVWLAMRFLVEGRVQDAVIIGVLALIWPSVLWIRENGEDLRDVFTKAGLALSAGLFITLLQWDPLTRFAGYSGNPNRMVYLALLTLPFLLAAVVVNREAKRLLYLLASAVITVAVLLSGSAQGLAGLSIIAVVCAFALYIRVRALSRRRLELAFAVIGAFVLGALVFAVLRLPGIARDLFTLSDRTPIFAAFVESYFDAPILGAGSNTVTLGEVADRSAHSSVLALFYAGGVFAGVLWCIMLAVLIHEAIVLIRADVTGTD